MARYRVCGSSVVLGNKPGKTFEADLDPVHEQRLIEGGHLHKLPDKAETKTTPAAPADPKE